MAAITASNIAVAQDPTDPEGGLLLTFTRSDTGASVTIKTSIVTSESLAAQEAQGKSAIQSWEAEANSIAGDNTALTGVTV